MEEDETEDSPEEVEENPKHNFKENFEKLKVKAKENPWIVTSAFLGIICIVLLILVLRPGLTGNVISGDVASQNLVDFLNSNVGGGVDYDSFTDLGNIYQVTVNYQGDSLPVYVTKDGKYFVQGISLITGNVVEETEKEVTQNIPKADLPVVELFVMTHCPYGTQSEKGIIPVIETLGADANIKIRFVHYFMHGDEEAQESYRQLCIREEQNSNYLAYLKCFLEAGDSVGCLSKAGINTVTLNTCIEQRAEDYYAQDSALSQQYGVQGSPTLVINGVTASSGRSSSAYLSTICSTMNTESEKCSETLSSANPSAGFGYGEGSSSSGSC